ncbi:complement resistance protein TraT [Campylobacter sp. MG1]|uniref:complement resistance protein TraT n=1 Tax=Campylobacter sp. MG1 TaxID=2976332 RepID=UPI00226D17DE|nr:complement resistance protein TraT [Campylobacter sp. MG1]
MYKNCLQLTLGSLIAMSLFSGCVTTNLQTNATMTQSIFIDPVAKDKKLIFLNIKNTSGQNINLESKLKYMLEQKGYIVVDNPENAIFILSTNVLYCNKKKENNAGIGAGIGAGTGLGVAAYNSNSMTGAVATTGAIALAGGLIGKLTEDTIYQMQVDVNIKQKATGKVLASTGTTQGQSSVNDSKRAGFMNSLAGNVHSDNSGHLNSNMVQSNSQSYETNYIEKNTMMFAEAIKIHLKLEEAIPVLEDKIANQISGLF